MPLSDRNPFCYAEMDTQYTDMYIQWVRNIAQAEAVWNFTQDVSAFSLKAK